MKSIFAMSLLYVLFLLTMANVPGTFITAGEKNQKGKAAEIVAVDSTVQKLSRTQVIQSLQSQIEAITREDAVVNANLRISRLQGQIDLLSVMKEDSITFPKATR